MDARPGPVAGHRIYEDFVPPHELVKGEKADTIVIDLTGFKKEQLKVQTDNYGKLRITGERFVGEDKWVRFRKDFQIPENCNTSEIRAKFENGRVSITLPKLVADQVPPQDQATQTTTTQDKPPVADSKLPSDEQREETRSKPPPVDAVGNAVAEAESTKRPEKEISAPVEPEKLLKKLQTVKQKVLESAYDSRKEICSAFAILVISVGVGLIISALHKHTMEYDGISN